MNLDTLGLIKNVTENVCKILKYKANEWVGDNINKLLTKTLRNTHNTILENYIKNYIRKEQSILESKIESFINVKNGYIIPIWMFHKPIIDLNNNIDIIINCIEIKENKNEMDYIIFNKFGMVEGFSFNIFNIFGKADPNLNLINIIPFCPELEYLIDSNNIYKNNNSLNTIIGNARLSIIKNYIDSILSTENMKKETKPLNNNYIIKNKKLIFFFPSNFIEYYKFHKTILYENNLNLNLKKFRSINKNGNNIPNFEIKIKKLYEYLINDKNSFELNLFCDLLENKIHWTNTKFYILRINNFLKNQFEDYNNFVNDINSKYSKNELENKKQIFKNIVNNKSDEINEEKNLKNFYWNITKNIFKLNLSIYNKDIYDYPNPDIRQNNYNRILYRIINLFIIILFIVKILLLVFIFKPKIFILIKNRVSNDIFNFNILKFTNNIYFYKLNNKFNDFNYNELFNSTLTFNNNEIWFFNNNYVINNFEIKKKDPDYIFQFKEKLFAFHNDPITETNSILDFVNNNLYIKIFNFLLNSNNKLNEKINSQFLFVNYVLYIIIIKFILLFFYFSYYYYLHNHLKKIRYIILFGFNFFNSEDLNQIIEFNNSISVRFKNFINRSSLDLSNNDDDLAINYSIYKQNDKKIKKELDLTKVKSLTNNKIIIIFLIIVFILFTLNIIWFIFFNIFLQNNYSWLIKMSTDNLKIQGSLLIFNLLITNQYHKFNDFSKFYDRVRSLHDTNDIYQNKLFSSYNSVYNFYINDVCTNNKCRAELVNISKNGFSSFKSNVFNLLNSNNLFNRNNIEINNIKNNYVSNFRNFIFIEEKLENLIYEVINLFYNTLFKFTIIFTIYNIILWIVFLIYFFIIFNKLLRIFYLELNYFRSIYKHYFTTYLINREKRFRYSLKSIDFLN